MSNNQINSDLQSPDDCIDPRLLNLGSAVAPSANTVLAQEAQSQSEDHPLPSALPSQKLSALASSSLPDSDIPFDEFLDFDDLLELPGPEPSISGPLHVCETCGQSFPERYLLK